MVQKKLMVLQQMQVCITKDKGSVLYLCRCNRGLEIVQDSDFDAQEHFITATGGTKQLVEIVKFTLLQDQELLQFHQCCSSCK